MQTLSHTLAAVKPQFAPAPWLVADADGELLDQAAAWGNEDATERIDMRGSEFFAIGTAAWHSYNDGYAQGVAMRKMFADAHPQTKPSIIKEQGELEFLGAALDQLRSGRVQPLVAKTPYVCTCGYSTTSDFLWSRHIEGCNGATVTEWIGAEISTAPYMW